MFGAWWCRFLGSSYPKAATKTNNPPLGDQGAKIQNKWLHNWVVLYIPAKNAANNTAQMRWVCWTSPSFYLVVEPTQLKFTIVELGSMPLGKNGNNKTLKLLKPLHEWPSERQWISTFSWNPWWACTSKTRIHQSLVLATETTRDISWLKSWLVNQRISLLKSLQYPNAPCKWYFLPTFTH